MSLTVEQLSRFQTRVTKTLRPLTALHPGSFQALGLASERLTTDARLAMSFEQSRAFLQSLQACTDHLTRNITNKQHKGQSTVAYRVGVFLILLVSKGVGLIEEYKAFQTSKRKRHYYSHHNLPLVSQSLVTHSHLPANESVHGHGLSNKHGR